MKFLSKLIIPLLLISCSAMFGDVGGPGEPGTGSKVADHRAADYFYSGSIPLSAINSAKDALHIAYGHTSHGSQLTTGMSGLVGFANNNNGAGQRFSAYPDNLLAWNDGGSGGALDLHDYAMGGDVGYYPQWVNNTRDYLGPPDSQGRGSTRPDVNVIIWSWCGQVNDQSTYSGFYDIYLGPMTQLETDYPGVTFIYMTGHLEGMGGEPDDTVKRNNDWIRQYCANNDKWLYDFADIEKYDPDGSYFGDKLVDDACSYDSDEDGLRDANWATDWQNSHTIDVDWYSCSSAHSQPLNANRKAYAAWWLWARLAGWDQWNS